MKRASLVLLAALAGLSPGLSAQVVYRDTFSRITGTDFNGPVGDLNAYGPSVGGTSAYLGDLRNINLLPGGRTWVTGRRDTTPSPLPNASNSFDRPWVYIGTVGTVPPSSWLPSPGYTPPSATPPAPNGGVISNVAASGIWGGMNTWMNLDVRAGGGFFREPVLSVRADVRPNTAPQTTGATAAFHGIGLGFWGDTNPVSTTVAVDGAAGVGDVLGDNAWTGFSGLVLRNDGRLSLLRDGSILGFVSVTTTGGGWTAQPVDVIQRELSYSVDTRDGSLATVSYNGASLTASQLLTLQGGSAQEIFTNARTARVGLYSAVTNPAGDVYGSFPKADNFEFVPEPAAYAALAGALALGLVVLRRRRA